MYFCYNDVMIEHNATQNDAGRRLDRFIAACYPHLPPSLIQRWIREKRVRHNGKHNPPSTRIQAGDSVRLFVAHDKLKRNCHLVQPVIEQPELDIVYEDEQIIVVNKPAGLSVHADNHATNNTLIAHIQAHCRLTGAWNPDEENAFAPALCHRLDKNTSGLLIAAKTAPALRVLNEAFAARKIRKFYLALVHGELVPHEGMLKHYLRRDTTQKRVYIYDKPVKNGKTAILRYRVLSGQEFKKNCAFDAASGGTPIEIELFTGRTHQIRAQMAHIGHPLVGDGKYGKASYRGSSQALCAYKLQFNLAADTEAIGHLSGREFALE